MAKYLVIVESPAKVKTIKKFLGKNYEVDASNGHVRDLPKSTLGFDAEHGFEPKYITIRGKGDVLAKLRKEVKKADVIYLATDPDREGEAISWHLFFALKLAGDSTIIKFFAIQKLPPCIIFLYNYFFGGKLCSVILKTFRPFSEKRIPPNSDLTKRRRRKDWNQTEKTSLKRQRKNRL